MTRWQLCFTIQVAPFVIAPWFSCMRAFSNTDIAQSAHDALAITAQSGLHMQRELRNTILPVYHRPN